MVRYDEEYKEKVKRGTNEMVEVFAHGKVHELRDRTYTHTCDRCGCKFSFWGDDFATFSKVENSERWYGLIDCPECGFANIVDLGDEKNEYCRN